MKRGTDKRKRALFTSHTANFQKFNHSAMALLKNNDWQVDYASTNEEKIKGADEVFKVNFARSPWRIGKHLKAYRQLKKILKINHYDIIHTHTPVGSIITRLAARKYRQKQTKVIYTTHGFHFYHGASILNWLLWYPIEKIAARWTDMLITINKEDYERAKKHFRTEVVYVPGVGADPKKFDIKMTETEKNKYRQTLGLSPDDHVIIYVAELSKRKNQEALLKELAPTIAKNPKTQVLLVGEDNLNGKVQKLAEQLGIVKNVHLLGYRTDIPELLKISDEYRSTSRQEGLALNIIEARLAGLPVKATKIRGHEPAFISDVTEFLTPNINKKMAKIYGVKDI
ncbi:MAG: glycosyltransferase [Candidatus Nomurabacteria bacterium]|nr:glycosyltransferase [Candidatus Nomurabacteria bacterium]